MGLSVDINGAFIQRPRIDDRFRSPDQEEVKVAAVWDKGVIFFGCKKVTPVELIQRFTPFCDECKDYHEPEYPHVLTREYRFNFHSEHGRQPTHKDTYSHCVGLIHQAMAASQDAVGEAA